MKKAGVEPHRAVQAFMVEGEVKKTLPRLWKRLLTRWRVLSSCIEEEEEEEEMSRSMMVVDCPAKQLMLGIARTIVYVFFFCGGDSGSSGEVCCAAAAAAAVSKFMVIADCMSFTVTPAKTLMMIFPRRESLI